MRERSVDDFMERDQGTIKAVFELCRERNDETLTGRDRVFSEFDRELTEGKREKLLRELGATLP